MIVAPRARNFAHEVTGVSTPQRLKLTQKMENFCVAYIQNGGKGSEAYRASYDASRMSPRGLHQRVNELMKNPKIIARLQELRAPVAAAAQISLAKHLADLLEIREKAMEAGNHAAAVSAEKARGKASGLYVERSETNVNINIGMADRLKSARERVIEAIPLKALTNEPVTH